MAILESSGPRLRVEEFRLLRELVNRYSGMHFDDGSMFVFERRLKDRLRARFNVSAAETDHQDLWQRAALTVAVVSTERAHAEQVLRDADRVVTSANGALVLGATAAWL